ncbi:MAG: hypothetical protein ACRDRW_10600, partial [Pseudonocardiaceae bacterium]
MTFRLTPASDSRGTEVSRWAVVFAAAVSRVARAVCGWSVPLLGLVLVVAGCTTSPSGQGSSGQGSSGVQRHQSLPPGCAHPITRADDVPAALD